MSLWSRLREWWNPMRYPNVCPYCDALDMPAAVRDRHLCPRDSEEVPPCRAGPRGRLAIAQQQADARRSR